MVIKKGLGKGLSALVEENIINPPVVELKPSENSMSLANKGVLMVAPECVLPSRYQPRKEFDEAFLEELADSIRKHGVIQPLVVSDLGNGTYELVAGERRLRASKLAQLTFVPVFVKEFDEKDRLAVALIENIQRADLNAMEISEAYKEMMDRLELTQEEVAKVVGKSRVSVANTLRLLKLPHQVRQMIVGNNISEGHGRAILALAPDYKAMEQVAHLAEEGDLSVRQTEELVRKMSLKDMNQTQDLQNPVLKNERMIALEEKLVRSLGLKTKVSGNTQKGAVKFFYHTPEDLEVLMKKLLTNY